MYCKNCGSIVEDEYAFCPVCGTEAKRESVEPCQIERKGTLTLYRRKSAYCKAANVEVKINDEVFKNLKQEEKAEIILPYGEYEISLRVKPSKPVVFRISLSESKPNVYYSFRVGGDGKAEYVGNGSTQKEEKKKSKGIGCLTSFVIVIAIIAVVNLALGGNNTKDGEKETVEQRLIEKTEESKNQTVQAPVPQADKEQKAQVEPEFLQVSGTVDNWEVTIKDFNYQETISAGLLTEYRPEENSYLLSIDVEVKNIGKTGDIFLPYIAFEGETVAKLHWKDYEYTMANLTFSDKDLLHEQLNPLVSTSGLIVFEVPKEMSESEVAPVLSILSGGEEFTCDLAKK